MFFFVGKCQGKPRRFSLEKNFPAKIRITMEKMQKKKWKKTKFCQKQKRCVFTPPPGTRPRMGVILGWNKKHWKMAKKNRTSVHHLGNNMREMGSPKMEGAGKRNKWSLDFIVTNMQHHRSPDARQVHKKKPTCELGCQSWCGTWSQSSARERWTSLTGDAHSSRPTPLRWSGVALVLGEGPFDGSFRNVRVAFRHTPMKACRNVLHCPGGISTFLIPLHFIHANTVTSPMREAVKIA